MSDTLGLLGVVGDTVAGRPTAEPLVGQRAPGGTVVDHGGRETSHGDIRPASGMGFDAEIGAFMASIRQLESGGRYGVRGPQTRYGRPRGAYQILDSNWPSWAAEAGMPSADWRDPAAQDHVARYKMTQYFRQFGSWEAVAVAWFAGPGRAQAYVANPAAVAGLSDVLGTSVARYVNTAIGGMTERLGTQGSATLPSGVNLQPGGGVWDRESIGAVAQRIADFFGVRVSSHFRDPDHNERVGGAKNSDHLWGGAIDFSGDEQALDRLAAWARSFTNDQGPFRIVLWRDNDPRGHGDHVHVSWQRNSSAPFELPGAGGQQPFTVGLPDTPVSTQQSALTLVGAFRDAIGRLASQPDTTVLEPARELRSEPARPEEPPGGSTPLTPTLRLAEARRQGAR